MSDAAFRVVALEAVYERTSFNSGSVSLDRYFRDQVTQDIRRRVSACFVAVAAEQRIAGYYTLASSSMLLTELPAAMAKKLPRYPLVPAVRMGRLAVDLVFRGRGLGAALLVDALDRAARSEIAAFSLVVDAKDESAVAFYRHHGFIALPDSPLTLFLPLATLRQSPHA
ncbi:GNAT family N-acetyltransferase [Thiocapsa bogorovii]|uniref:GNAT family N-acetyltransferase n=1 Tax=Thiocapsa bogorovii TaxID=521689 RepID=UPI001E37A4A0|nr:GNAT family N-acetyltransferase [Thiocapsa bogorovii]UHD17472.1 GNAT family N-acetyltransferase [Thiocapsa bogorovii]